MKPIKALPVLIILILALPATLTIQPASATPSVPEFTVEYIDRAYDVPPTYRTDPYTGATIQTSPGYHASNKTIDVIIKNQPFTPYVNENNQTIALYYDIRVKGHYEDWGSSSTHSARAIKASSSSHTVVTFLIGSWGVETDGKIDFQVKAVTGYSYYNSNNCYNDYQVDTVSDSGWSNTVMLTLGGGTNTSTPTIPPYATPTPTPDPTATAYPTETPTSDPLNPIHPDTQTGFLSSLDWKQTALIVMAVVIAVLVVAIVLVIGRRTPSK